MPNAVQIINPTREQARDLTGVDFNARAELYPSCNKKSRGRVTHKRFDPGAEALRFAIQDMPKAALLGAYVESEETRFGRQEIRALYESAEYSVTRPAS
jgi:hypothetical protein